MDLRQLRYFQVIAEEGQISKAAKRLHMAQPPLSHQLKQLELEIGTRLMERGSRKITLTDAGKLLHERADQIFELVNLTLAQLQDIGSGVSGTLSIGTVASSGTTFLPDLILRFHEQYPNIQFQVREGDTPRILDLLLTGVIELGIVRAVFDPEVYHSHALPSEPMVVAGLASFVSLDSSAGMTINKLAAKPLLVHRSNESKIVECFHQHGYTHHIICLGDDVRSLLSWADCGIGLAIVPQSAVGLISSERLIYQTISEPSLNIKKAIVWTKNRHLSIVAQKFLELASFAGE
jgi:DNA-binding transcriptional LysR family regulator